MKGTIMHRSLALGAALALLAITACSPNEDTSSDTPEDTGAPDSTTVAAEIPAAWTGEAPGVTDDAIKVGIPYLDLEAIQEIVDLDQGDFRASYQALIDQINDAGGIHGRMIEPVYAPINPADPTSAEQECVRLTEDEDVFVAVGYFQDDGVLCPVADHATAVIGGNVTGARYEQAEAPWFTVDPGEDEEVEAVRALAEGGELDGNLGVFASILNEADLNDVYLPLLDELGIDVVDSAVLDAPFDDATAQNQATAVIAERFRSQDIDTVLAIGTSALPLANGLTPLDYRPLLRATNNTALGAYAYGANPDFDLIDPAIVGGADNARFDEPGMQECLATLVDAGVEPEFVDPADIPLGERTPYNAALAACRHIPLLQAILEAAGPELDYASFEQAGRSLEGLQLPGTDEPLDYGPYPANDGNPPMVLQTFDRDLNSFVAIED